MPIATGQVPGLQKPVSRLILGCGSFRPEDLPRAAALLDAFTAAGGTALDTAHIYGRDGASERAVGQWIADRGCRDAVVVITKGAHHDAEGKPRVNPAVIDAELAESLARLHTDYVDLYLLHRDDPTAPVGPIVECLNRHVAAGRIRAFGGSNWSPSRIEAANAYAQTRGLHGMVASSPHLALAVAHDPPNMGHAIVSGDPDALAWYRATQFPLLAWTAQAQGFFSERADPADPAAVRHFRRYDHPDNWERRRRAWELAERMGIPPTRIPIAWMLEQGLNAFPIIGPGSLPHLEDAIAALRVHLGPGALAWLNLEPS